MARKHGVTSLADLMPPDIRAALEAQQAKEESVTWVARTPLLRIKPISSSDPVLFLKVVTRLKELYPDLNIYIFKIVK